MNNEESLSVPPPLDEHRDFDEDEEDPNEIEAIQKVIKQHQVHRGPIGPPERPAAASHRRHNQQTESLASRYYRKRNLTWVRGGSSAVNNHNNNSSNETSNHSASDVPGPLDNPRADFGRGNLPPRHQPFNTEFLDSTVGASYVCHLCGERGHHIRNCPKAKDTNRRFNKKVKPSTGLPRSWLQRIPVSEVPKVEGDVYQLTDGGFAVMKSLRHIYGTNPNGVPEKSDAPGALSSSSIASAASSCVAPPPPVMAIRPGTIRVVAPVDNRVVVPLGGRLVSRGGANSSMKRLAAGDLASRLVKKVKA